MSKIAEIDNALFEAKMFIQKALAWKQRLKNDELACLSGSKQGSACKRASMDLSRSLAELRKPSGW